MGLLCRFRLCICFFFSSFFFVFFFFLFYMCLIFFFFFSSRRRHTRSLRDWSSDVCSSDLVPRGRGRLHLLHEKARDGLSHGGPRSGAPRRDHHPRTGTHRPGPAGAALPGGRGGTRLVPAPAAGVPRRPGRPRLPRVPSPGSRTTGVLGLGFGPRGKAFLEGMKQLGVKEELLLEAGLLVKRDDGSIIPRFRERVLFPILDLRGRVVAFGGRVLGDGEPKYLNSPETPIFHKGQMLYNLHAARHAIRKAERAVLVEGYFDTIRLALAGIEEVIAPLGTGLTSDQAELLKRHTAHVILLYDSDDAGLRATFRAGDELLHHGLRVSVATLPEGEDPDTLVQREGGAALERVLKDAVDVFDRKLQILEQRGMFGTLPGRRRALDRLLPTIRAARDPITKELYLARAAEAAHVRKDVLEREVSVQGVTGVRSSPPSPTQTAPDSRLPAPSNAERVLLLVLLAGDPWRARVLEAASPDMFEFAAYREVFEAVRSDDPSRLDSTAARLYEQLAAEKLAEREPGAMLEDALNKIAARGLDRRIETIDRAMSVAGPDEQRALIMKKQQLTAERNAKSPTYKIATRRKGAPGS